MVVGGGGWWVVGGGMIQWMAVGVMGGGAWWWVVVRGGGWCIGAGVAPTSPGEIGQKQAQVKSKDTRNAGLWTPVPTCSMTSRPEVALKEQPGAVGSSPEEVNRAQH